MPTYSRPFKREGDFQKRTRAVKTYYLALVPLLAVAVLFGSGCPARPGAVQPSLVINLGFPNWPPTVADNFTRQLRDGTLTLEDVRIQSDLQRSSCTFAADYANSSAIAPDFQSNGTPGTPAYNVHFVSLALQPASGLTRPCPADATPTGIVLQPNPGITVGQPIRLGRAELDFANQVAFVTDRGFFEFTLNTLNLNTNVATASFRLILRNDANTNDTRVIFASGSLTMPVHVH